jgi:catechol 2,3-dioxygenase-like lactoylglutathione lyase family enzyme
MTALPEGLRARLSFVKVIVRDLAPTQDFYVRALGLSVLQHIDAEHMEEIILGRTDGLKGEPALVLYRHKDGRALASGDLHGPIGFNVSDVDAVYEHAVSQGAVPLRPPFTFGKSRVAFIADPDGHEIELLRFTS